MATRRKVRYRKRQCPRCGMYVSTNALGRAAHQRSRNCQSPAERIFEHQMSTFIGPHEARCSCSRCHEVRAKAARKL